MRPRHASAGWALALIGLLSAPCLALDRNNNQQSDVWEMIYNATGLVAAADADSDGVPNAAESIAGTDPRNAGSFPVLALGTNGVQPAWDGKPGKVYQLLASPSLAPALWTVLNTTTGSGAELSRVISTLNVTQSLLRISIADLDRDGDQLTDWDEVQLGFDPESQHSERYSNTDSQRVASAISMISTITVSIIDGEMYERWPDAGVIAVRRSGGIRPLTVNLTFGGSATRGTDYTNAPGTNLTISAGRTEAWIECWPVADAANTETTETITVTLAAGSNYVIGAGNSASLNLYNETTSSLPNPKSAGRFLVQAAFGPDADATNDVDMVPENVEEVQVLGFEAWITNQFARPVGRLQPFTEYAATNIPDFYVDAKEAAWWNRAMGVPSLIPGGPAQQPDPLRQRIGFALSQIFVISDRLDAIGNNPAGMAHYYDLLLTNAFGNYRDLLYHVTLHPCMGLYLSHLGNQKPDPINNIYPDENYAREVMQLFSIGLWELHQDGSRKTNALGQWIPTYDNARITQFARVFTGLGFGGTNATSFYAPYDLLAPMKLWDEFHDCDPKTLLNGQILPARTPSSPDTGSAALLDINAAINNIFNHSNVAPFVCRQLIQRLVTSNPSTGYIARVAAAFNNNGAGIRGDMKAVIKAILLDNEARDPAFMSDPKSGKQREPFLRVVNFARAFNAAAPAGFYELDEFYMDHYQEPLKSPSVFNFYLPAYTPPGPAGDAGLVGPEFQLLNAGSSMSTANYYYNALQDGLHRWGNADTNRLVTCDFTQELALVNNIDALIRRLDLHLTYGTLSPRQFQIIRNAVLRVNSGMWDWENRRIWLAVYLIVTSPEFAVML